MEYPPRLLAEALRARLTSPSDQVPGQPAGRLDVERAWLPVFRLPDQEATVLTVLTADDRGTRLDRRPGVHQADVSIDVSVQRLLANDAQTSNGKQELDGIADFAEAVLLACFQPTEAADGRRYHPVSYERTFHDDALLQWNQACLLFTITYRWVS